MKETEVVQNCCRPHRRPHPIGNGAQHLLESVNAAARQARRGGGTQTSEQRKAALLGSLADLDPHFLDPEPFGFGLRKYFDGEAVVMWWPAEEIFQDVSFDFIAFLTDYVGSFGSGVVL